MKILHIMASKGLGGAETYSTDIMLSLHKEGVDQCVIMSDKAPRYHEIVESGIRVESKPLSLPFRFLQRYAVKKIISREKPDIIHCWMRRAASVMPRWKNCPVIGWFGGYYDPKHFKKCTHFVGVTRDIVAHMKKNGVADDKAEFIPTFPDIDMNYTPINRETLNTPAAAIVLLALSRLHPKKGLDTLLLAAKKMPGVYVWLAGEGPLRKKLEKLAVRLGVDDRVRFLGWRTDRSALLRSSDICVLPSRYEPFGTVILEAWAAKTPLVACKSAGPAAHIRDAIDGLLVPIDDPDALVAALKRVQMDTDLRRSMVSEGYNVFMRDYTREAVTKRMTEHYDKLRGEFLIGNQL